MTSLQVDPKHLLLIQDILKRIPNEVYVFGSRAKGTARPLSDLDLVIKGPVEMSKLSLIKEDLEESKLPYKVDIVLWNRIDDNFKKTIEPDLLPLQNIRS